MSILPLAYFKCDAEPKPNEIAYSNCEKALQHTVACGVPSAELQGMFHTCCWFFPLLFHNPKALHRTTGDLIESWICY